MNGRPETIWRGGTMYEYIYGRLRRELPTNGIAREWHANGVLAREMKVVNGVAVGTIKEWFDNGQLAKETPIERGKIHGTVYRWARDGRLLGSYEMRWGTGTAKDWDDDGSLNSEMTHYGDGTSHGKSWDDKGKLHETFSLNGRTVSKRKFFEKLNSADVAE
jgi:antitoxin component YwqK of YwqJK toxin-antitoxin module